MSFKSLLDAWAAEETPTRTAETYNVHLTIEDAAKIHALAELFPGVDHERGRRDQGRQDVDRHELRHSLAAATMARARVAASRRHDGLSESIARGCFRGGSTTSTSRPRSIASGAALS